MADIKSIWQDIHDSLMTAQDECPNSTAVEDLTILLTMLHDKLDHQLYEGWDKS